jgi:type II secretory pathway component PulF
MELVLGEFSYKAVDRGGSRISGTVEATDRRSAVAALVERGHFVTELFEAAQRQGGDGHRAPLLAEVPHFHTGHVSSRDVLAITTQLSTAVRAGLPLLNALELIGKQQRKPAMRHLFDRLVRSVNAGQSLSEAMKEHKRVFNPLYLSMIRVGETGGILEQTSTQLAMILAREDRVKTNLLNASAYPLFLLGLGLLSAVVIVAGILPRILSLINIGAAMPLPTRVLMSISAFLRGIFTTVQGWVAIVVLVMAVYAFIRWTRTSGRLQWDTFKLKMPFFGRVLRTISVGRFARTLGALTKGGVTILEALAVVRDTMGNEVLARHIDEVAEKVKRGASLAEPLEQSGCFPPLLVQIVAIGEQTGRLDELLLNAADTFDGDADAAINRFMAIFPPLLILFLGLIIGFIIAAALLPIVTMSLGAGNM